VLSVLEAEMDLIGTTELKRKLDRGEAFKLVMCLGRWAYRAKHIPGSLRLSTMEEWPEYDLLGAMRQLGAVPESEQTASS
jgi:hypothetical protein